jgi:SAM-dependent methyltransferase
MHQLDERALWNEKFRSGSHASTDPDPFLVAAYRDYVEPLLGEVKGRSALDLAGGTGRHAIFLAKCGWDLTLLDISEVGLEDARREAETQGLSIHLRNEDAKVAELGSEKFDLILVFFFLQRELFPVIRSALKPGGILIYKTYTAEHPRLSGGRGPKHPMHLLESNELVRLVLSPEATPSFRATGASGGSSYKHDADGQARAIQLLFYCETVVNKGVAELVARKLTR